MERKTEGNGGRPALQPWQQTLTNVVFGILITGLAGLGLRSVIYLFYEAPKKLEELSIEREKYFEKEMQALKRGGAFAHSARKAFGNHGERMKFFGQFNWAKRDILGNESIRRQIHVTCMEARLQASEDLGALEAYSQQSTGIPAEWLNTNTGVLRAEIRLWESFETLIDTAKRAPKSSLEEDAFLEFTRRSTELLVFFSKLSVFSTDIRFWIETREREIEQVHRRRILELNNLLKWSILSFVGATCSVFGVFFAIQLILRWHGSAQEKPRLIHP